ncbi:hypothetical protein [Streptosporangium sp. NPDC006007]|uniref:hypothetical protein n=1 Tax=Streptosporangium sp. NPDC006007 TaxID=3154575 RepID=UPI0033B3F806
MKPEVGREGLKDLLSRRLFQRRVDLVLALDRQDPAPAVPGEDVPDGTRSEAGLRRDLAERLCTEVAGMDLDNIEVRPHRQQVEKYRDPATWQKAVTPEAHAEVTDRLAGLPTAFREDESGEEAKRFDLLALKLQLAALNLEPGFDRFRGQVQEIASALLDQTTIPAIKAQQVLLDELTADEWRQDVTLPMLELMRRRVRGLVHLVQKVKRGILYTDFQDELGDLTLPMLQGVTLGTNRTKFEAKVRMYLRNHENELAVQKLRRNRQITTHDLFVLEKIFIEAGYGTDEDVEQVTTEYRGFGLVRPTGS